MRLSTSTAATTLAFALPLALAQTYTNCNPTEKTCPADTGLPSSSYTTDFTSAGSNASWSVAAGTTLQYSSTDGAVFSISNAAQAPTIATDFYIFFGRTDVVFRAASGQGIVSSIVLQSDDLDEIDWEFIGGAPNQVQSNYYGKGNTTVYDRVEYHDVDDTENTWHTYSVDWNAERIEWIIDGTVVRTLPYAAALNGQNFPQTPMQMKLGNWAAGASKNQGTAQWAGGAPDWSLAPFNMYVKSVTMQNYNPACQYVYDGLSGSWQSIQVVKSSSSCSASGASPSSATVAAVSSGSAQASVASTATSAPTSSHSVIPVTNTKVVASTSIQGSPAVPTSTGGMNTTFTRATTGVASQPTVPVNGTVGGASSSASAPTSSSSLQASTGGSSSQTASLMATSALLSIVAAVFLL